MQAPEVERRVLTSESAREIDRLAVTRYRMPSILLMENAAANAARILIERRSDLRRAVIACGPGNNGGDGYAMARHLSNAGVAVKVVAMGAPRTRSDALVQRDIAHAMGIQIVEWPERPTQPVELIVDGLFGTGLDRTVEGAAAEVIGWINECRRGGATVVSLDIPSGLHSDRGVPLGTAVEADLTITFAGLKSGLLAAGADRFVGTVVVADIGVPCELVEALASRDGRVIPNTG